MSYQPDLRAALQRTVDWFRANPDKRVTGQMSNNPDDDGIPDPFADNATCFCFGGRLAREMGQLPPEMRDKDEYIPAYGEFDAVGIDPRDIYYINDSAPIRRADVDKLIEAETQMLAERYDLRL